MLVSGEGSEYLARIESCGRNEVRLLTLSAQVCAAESDIRVTLFQCLPKNGKRETIVQMCVELGVSPEQTALMQQLVSLYGPLDEMLRAVEPLPLPAESRAAVQELRALAGQLALYGLDTVRLDFSLVNDVDYYNGIVFRGFLDGVAAGVLSGGRYDRLMTRMGKRGGAIGFAVYLDRLERFQEERAAYDVDTLIVYAADSDVPLAIRTAEALVRRGAAVRVERAAPAGLTFRQKLTVRGGEVTEDA